MSGKNTITTPAKAIDEAIKAVQAQDVNGEYKDVPWEGLRKLMLACMGVGENLSHKKGPTN